MSDHLTKLYAELNNDAVDLIRAVLNKHTTTILEEMKQELIFWKCAAADNQSWFAASERDRNVMAGALKLAEIELRDARRSHTAAYQSVVKALEETK